MTAISKDHRRGALGVRCHSGWAATVIVAADGNDVIVLDRRRVELCDPQSRGSKQPFHHAEALSLAEAQAFIAKCRRATAMLSRRAIEGLLTCATEQGVSLNGCALLVTSSRVLPPLKKILANHALIHTAEGMFYRNAMAAGAELNGIGVIRVHERDALRQASDHTGIGGVDLQRRVVTMGKHLGAPWTEDQKLATLAAWSLLAVNC